MINLHELQKKAIDDAVTILHCQGHFCYISAEMRCGKTPITLGVIDELVKYYGSVISKVLFVTKKRVINDVYELKGVQAKTHYYLEVTNYEQLENLVKSRQTQWDIIVLDEAHVLGTFPKPNNKVRALRNFIGKFYIFLSGTPTPESYSQIYHQMFAAKKEKDMSFYTFAKQYVAVELKRYSNGAVFNDYSKCSVDAIKHYIGGRVVKLTQKDLNIPTQKEVEYIYIQDEVKPLCDRLRKNKVITILNEEIIAGNTSKEMSLVHQMCGGFVYKSKNEYILLNDAKCKAIQAITKSHKKVCVFYYFKAENEIIAKYLQKNNIPVFIDYYEYTQASEGVFLCQISSGAEGITLKDTSAIIYYNISFSSAKHIQSKERATHFLNASTVKIIYLLSSIGFEKKVLTILEKKKKFTANHYIKYFQNA